jgi:zinc protease
MNKFLTFAFFALFVAASCTKKAVPTAPTKPNLPTIPTAPSANDFRKTPPMAGPAPKIQISRAETFTLDNGLKVIVVPNSKLPRISFQIFVDSDPVLEGQSAGYTQIMGDLLSKGTTRMGKSEMDQNIDFIGANFSTSASGVSGSCLTKHADALLGIMSDVLINPAFSDAELKKAKVRMQSNLANEKDDANAISGNVSSVLNFGSKHPYGEILTEASLEKIELAQIKQHYSTYFKPNVSYLVVVGDVTKAKAEVWAKKYFSLWQRGDAPKSTYAEAKSPAATEVAFVHKPGAVQSVVNITYPVNLRPGTPDVIPASVMATLLGGYFNSRLNQNLREGKAYTYGARSSINTDPINGSFSANASVRNEVTDSSVVEFLKEMNSLRTESIPADELEIVKSVMTGNFASSLERPETVARFALNTARYKLAPDYYETYLQRLAAVTPALVQQMAAKYIQPDKAYITVVGEKGTAEKLNRFSVGQKVKFYDTEGKPVVENTVKIPEGVNALSIIAGCISATGGETALKSVKDMTVESKLNGLVGMPLDAKRVFKSGNKFLFEIKMGENTLIKQVTDGQKGASDGMKGAEMLEGEALADLKREAVMFPELNYSKDSYTMLLKGIETVGSEDAYVIEISEPSGWKGTNYYSVKSGLKLRDVRVTEEGGETMTISTDFMDYKPVNGVQVAHKLKIVGMGPGPATMEVSSVKINTKVEDSVFTVK